VPAGFGGIEWFRYACSQNPRLGLTKYRQQTLHENSPLDGNSKRQRGLRMVFHDKPAPAVRYIREDSLVAPMALSGNMGDALPPAGSAIAWLRMLGLLVGEAAAGSVRFLDDWAISVATHG
jgi:hypothetical protein